MPRASSFHVSRTRDGHVRTGDLADRPGRRGLEARRLVVAGCSPGTDVHAPRTAGRGPGPRARSCDDRRADPTVPASAPPARGSRAAAPPPSMRPKASASQAWSGGPDRSRPSPSPESSARRPIRAEAPPHRPCGPARAPRETTRARLPCADPDDRGGLLEQTGLLGRRRVEQVRPRRGPFPQEGQGGLAEAAEDRQAHPRVGRVARRQADEATHRLRLVSRTIAQHECGLEADPDRGIRGQRDHRRGGQGLRQGAVGPRRPGARARARRRSASRAARSRSDASRAPSPARVQRAWSRARGSFAVRSRSFKSGTAGEILALDQQPLRRVAPPADGMAEQRARASRTLALPRCGRRAVGTPARRHPSA